MKIAFLNKYQNSVNRGAETYVSELSSRLSKAHTVDVIHNINYLKILFGKYDLIIPTNGRAQVFLTRIIAWIAGARMVVSGQSGIGLDDRLNLYAFPDVFIALSTHALAWARKINPFVRSVYIPNGVDLERFNSKKDFKASEKNKTVITVGAFTEQKRHDLVIKAVSAVGDVNLIIAGGGGDLKNEIEDMANDIIGSDKVSIVETSNKMMPEIYKKADLFTLASKPSESFGIVLVEAMASGLPIVANDDPIRREIVGDAGLFVDPLDTNSYTETLKKALSLKWGDKPRNQAKKFSWDNIAAEYNKIINKL